MSDTLPERGRYDLAERITGLPRRNLHTLVHRGEIPHIRLGPRMVVFERDALLAWMDERHLRLSRYPALRRAVDRTAAE